ncbi:multidrug resistance efflux transporter family protein [Paludifilum halophilum]|nr:multidrug resistance efflux transporter family protein [Paludifilum halophilum]
MLSVPWPSPVSWIGILLVAGGMVLHSYGSREKEPEPAKRSVA